MQPFSHKAQISVSAFNFFFMNLRYILLSNLKKFNKGKCLGCQLQPLENKMMHVLKVSDLGFNRSCHSIQQLNVSIICLIFDVERVFMTVQNQFFISRLSD